MLKTIKYCLTVLLVLAVNGCATVDYTEISGKQASFERVFGIPDTPKEELYDRAQQYMANTYRSAQNVIQYESKETGRIIGKGIFSAPYKGGLTTIYLDFRYTQTIDVKDGKARSILSDFAYVSGGKPIKWQWEKDIVAPPAEQVLADFERALKDGASASADW